jgi:hypothetical protein
MSDELLAASPAPAQVSVGNDEVGTWVEQVPPEHRGYDFLKGKLKPVDLVVYTKSREDELVKLSEQLKGSKPPKPGADAKPEDIQKYREAYGLPASKDEIKFLKEGDLKGFADNKDLEGFYAEMFFKNDIPKDTASVIFKEIALKGKSMLEANQKAQIEARETAKKEALAGLQKSYGQDFEANMKVISDFGKSNFGEQVWQKIEASDLDTDIGFISPLLELGKEFGSGRFVKGSSGSQVSEKTIAQVLFPGLK